MRVLTITVTLGSLKQGYDENPLRFFIEDSIIPAWWSSTNLKKGEVEFALSRPLTPDEEVLLYQAQQAGRFLSFQVKEESDRIKDHILRFLNEKGTAAVENIQYWCAGYSEDLIRAKLALLLQERRITQDGETYTFVPNVLHIIVSPYGPKLKWGGHDEVSRQAAKEMAELAVGRIFRGTDGITYQVRRYDFNDDPDGINGWVMADAEEVGEMDNHAESSDSQ